MILQAAQYYSNQSIPYLSLHFLKKSSNQLKESNILKYAALDFPYIELMILEILKVYFSDILIENDPTEIKQRRDKILQMFSYLEKAYEIRTSKMRNLVIEEFR